MNCYYHPHRPAVAQCVDCHKGLCYHCAHKYTYPICKECNSKRKSENIVHFLTPLVICGVLYYIGCQIKDYGPSPELNGYLLMCVYGGWKAINQFLPMVLVWLNLESIFSYLLFKLVLALLLGVFITPFYIIYCLFKFIQCLMVKI